MDIQEPAFVSSASVAAELATVSQIAKEMSISVKNAKAIANRAGAKARGFSPITDFIDEMSVETMKLVNRINAESVELSTIAISDLRNQESYEKFLEVTINSQNSKYIGSLEASVSRVRNRRYEGHVKLIKFSKMLQNLLDDIGQRMAVANVIVSNSRIEAVNAEEYRANLESIANDIEASCEVIRERVKVSQNRLVQAVQEWKRKVNYEIS